MVSIVLILRSLLHYGVLLLDRLGRRRRFFFIVLLLLLFTIVELLRGLVLIKFVELEGFSVLLADVLARGQTVQVKDQMKHLFVGLLVVEGDDWDSIIDLIGEGVDGVVHDYHVLHATIGNDAQILHVVAFGGLHAVLSVETVLEKFVLGVNVVENGVGVGLMRRREHDHLE